MEKAHLVGVGADPRQQVADGLAAAPAGLEGPERLDQVAVLALEGDEIAGPGHGGVVALLKLGLVVESVHMTERAGAEDDQHPGGLGPGVGRPRVQSAISQSTTVTPSMPPTAAATIIAPTFWCSG